MRISPILSAITGQAAVSSMTSSLTQLKIDEFTKLLPSLPKGSQRIYLIRHGETDWNRMGKIQGGGFDIALNTDGRKQAQNVADLLSALPLEVVASSHLQRARETADRIHSRHPEAQRIVNEGFGEMRFGEMEGTFIRGPQVEADRKKVFSRHIKAMRLDKTLPWPGDNGESIQDVENRAIGSLQSIIEENPKCSHLAVVAHGRTNKILLQALLAWSDGLVNDVVQGNTCVNVLDRSMSSGTYVSHMINFTDHVESETGKNSPS